MKMRLYTIARKWGAAVTLLFAGACADEVNTFATQGGDEQVVLTASTMGTGIATRADEGLMGKPEAIKDRKLLFTYPAVPDGEMASAVCLFNEAGFGYVYTHEETKEPLLWKDIYVKDKNQKIVEAVYLDNLWPYPVLDPSKNKQSRARTEPDNFTGIDFGPQDPTVPGDKQDNKYKRMIAAKDSPEAEIADIIWGKLENVGYGTALRFSLKHKMSAIAFRFHSEIEELETLLKGDKINVWLDYVRIWAETKDFEASNQWPFNRSTGMMYHAGYGPSQYLIQDFVYLVKDAPLQSDDVQPYLSTPVWVLPPYDQPFPSGIPVLTIDLGDGEVYSGSFPENMKYWSYNANTQKWTLLEHQKVMFKAGYQLTFTVKLNKDFGNREIQFLNAQVQEMGLRLTEKPTLNQNGINNWDDLMTLVELYNKDVSSTNYRLYRFGTWSDTDMQWTFILWRDIKMPEGTQIPQFKNGNFMLDFNGCHIWVGKQEITQTDLIQ